MFRAMLLLLVLDKCQIRGYALVIYMVGTLQVRSSVRVSYAGFLGLAGIIRSHAEECYEQLSHLVDMWY